MKVSSRYIIVSDLGQVDNASQHYLKTNSCKIYIQCQSPTQRSSMTNRIHTVREVTLCFINICLIKQTDCP